MQGFVRAVLRLVVMALVTGAVLVGATALGLPMAAGLGLAITAAGIAGLLGLARRGRPSPAAPALQSAAVADRAQPGREPAPAVVGAPATASAPAEAIELDPVIASMAPGQEVDPELLMPRWRRPSLLAARRGDPVRAMRADRMPMRFASDADAGTSRRIVRYAVVPLLDRGDEVLGRPLMDLMEGDEVEVLDPSGPFWEVRCPDGMRGWVHRTTLGAKAAESTWSRRAETEPDDLLTAVLSARGIQ